MQWDAALLGAWRREDYMSYATSAFMGRHKLTREQFQELARTPVFKQFHMPARGFVASALPVLSEALWAGVSDVAALTLMDGLKTGRPGTSRYMRGPRADKKDQASVRSVDIHAGHRRRDWHVCK